MEETTLVFTIIGAIGTLGAFCVAVYVAIKQVPAIEQEQKRIRKQLSRAAKIDVGIFGTEEEVMEYENNFHKSKKMPKECIIKDDRNDGNIELIIQSLNKGQLTALGIGYNFIIPPTLSLSTFKYGSANNPGFKLNTIVKNSQKKVYAYTHQNEVLNPGQASIIRLTITRPLISEIWLGVDLTYRDADRKLTMFKVKLDSSTADTA